MTTPKTTSTFSFPMLAMLVLHALLALAWSLPSVVTAPRAHAQELTESRRVRIARRLAQSTVSVISGPSTGSGFVVGDERWVITNHHVVESARLGVQVRFGSGTTLQARVIRLDPSHDLAILEVVGGRVPSPPLDLANSDDVEVGQTVLAFGSPFGLEGTLTEGIVSARRDVPDVGGGMARRLIQTDAPINPGNSGGPLVDRRGRVIGVNTAILSRTGGSHGIGFAVPSNYVGELLANTREQRRSSPASVDSQGRPNGQPGASSSAGPAQGPAYLGVRGRDFAAGGFVGVQVESVMPGSPAQRAGLLGVLDSPPELVARLGIPWTGHIITSVDGRPVRNAADLEQAVQVRAPGSVVELTVTVGPGLLNGTRRISLSAAP
ncbi:MAG: S1C family serine protease [Deltaproteobacteria bacterium]|jgi:S1-C subfamily serine protease